MTVKDADTLKSYFLLTKVPAPSQYIDLIDTIFAQSTGGDHDHDDRYVQVAIANNISAVHTFSPSIAGPPFILGSNAQGYLVSGLYADKLNKSITASFGLYGGGTLTDNISLAIDLNSPSGLSFSGTKLEVNDGIAGAGLTISGKVLAIGEGDGLTVSTDAIALTLPGTLSYNSTNISSGSHKHTILNSSAPGASASILSTNTNGVLELVTLKTEILQDRGITGSVLINPTGDISLDPGGNDVLPVTNYEINLGTLNKKYLTIHAAELWVETLVTQDTMATIGGRILIAPTTTLTQDFLVAATTIHVKHNQMTNGDRVYLETAGQIEWIAITSGPTAESGGYYYSVTRNLDGSGANDWVAGNAVLNTGTIGDGYIDIYSIDSIRSGTQYGPTIVGNIRTGSTYSDLIEGWVIGNLNGLYGYGVDLYGAAFGKYVNSSSFLAIDPTNGIRMIYKNESGANLTLAQWDISGNLTIGQTGISQDNICISAGAIDFRVNTTSYINMTTTGVITVGLNSGGNVYISAAGLAIRNATTTVINLDTSGNALFGRIGAAYANVLWNASNNRLEFRSNITVKSYFDTDGSLVVIDPGGGIYDRAAAITWNSTSGDIATVGSYSDGYLVGTEFKTLPITGKYSTIYITGESATGTSAGAIISALVGSTRAKMQFSVSGSNRNIFVTADKMELGANNDPCNLIYTGKMVSWRSTGVQYDTWPLHPLITAPLTSTSWDGDLHSSESKTLIDLSSVFGAPPGIKAVLVKLGCSDSASATSDVIFILAPNNTNLQGMAWRIRGWTNNVAFYTSFLVPCDENGDIYYQLVASGTNTMACYLEIWGYCI